MSTNLEHQRHTLAHLLAAAVLELYPDAKRTIGPAIENGFYYDFGDLKIADEDLPKIEDKMRELLPSWTSMTGKAIEANEAKKLFADNPYKLELIEEYKDSGLTTYTSGNYVDLCRGGHTENPAKEIKPDSFKLTHLAGAYWRGSEKNAMLTRIYGLAFNTKAELDAHLAMLEEAKKRDHRKLGQQLELFTIREEVGQGLVLWLPRGTIVKDTLEAWGKETEAAWGYQRVSTPHITKSDLFYTSGHLPYYKGDMYPPMTLDDGQEYFLKPMNCPHHHMIYSTRPHSYRELPMRLAEYGTVYRYESSGELFGLMRVRGMTQNDSHIYCTIEQAVDEFVQVMKLHEYYYKALGINEYHLELALRDPANTKKYHGDEAMWQLAEKLMREAVAKTDIPMVEQIGSAAFYGPKIDFIIHSSIGREFAISTNQIDLFMGQRFGLEYIDDTGQKKTPAIIHRAPLGSTERFIGFLIEHFAGAFPVWLAPVQIAVLPISEKHLKEAHKVAEYLKTLGLRVELHDQNESFGKKIRNAELMKIPYLLVMGDKEIEAKKTRLNVVGQVAVRQRGKGDLGQVALEDFISNVLEEVRTKVL